MRTLRNWTLGAKLFLVATPFLLVALFSIGALVWMSLQLEGGAASVNEAGRMRMQAYRMLLSAGAGAVPGNEAVLPQQVAEFERSLVLLRNGDSERPLFVPWDETVRQSFKTVERDWEHFRQLLEARLEARPLFGRGIDTGSGKDEQQALRLRLLGGSAQQVIETCDGHGWLSEEEVCSNTVTSSEASVMACTA